MVGFLVNNAHCRFEEPAVPDLLLREHFDCMGCTVSRKTLRKFLNDKLFFQDETAAVVLEGAILNKKALCRGKPWPTVAKDNLLSNAADAINAMRGPFSGAFCNKQTGEWTIFTSHTGYGMVYYYFDGALFIASSDYNEIVDILRDCNIPLVPNETSAIDMLTFGYMTGDETLIKGIKRLQAGHILIYNGNDIRIEQYHAFRITDQNHGRTEKEMIDTLDRLFTDAVRMEFEKDREYGYRHICSISGGLDSRLVAWVAGELGYADRMTLIEYGKGDYIDEQVAKQIARYWRCELMVKPFDDARFMGDFKDAVRENNGLSLYLGTAHAESMYRLMNFDAFGLMHTGEEQLFWDLDDNNDYTDTKTSRLSYAYSRFLMDRYQITDAYPHHWEFCMYTRGFQGNGNSANAKTKHILHCCPFQNVELTEYVFSLPVEVWRGDALYKKWYISKHPEACTFPVERYHGAKITSSEFVTRLYQMKRIGARETASLILNKLGLSYRPHNRTTKNHMNPFDHWYRLYPDTATYMDSFMQDTLLALQNKQLLSDQLAGDMRSMYQKGVVIDKGLVLTVLAAFEQFLL